MNVEVAVLGSPSLTVVTVFANVTQNLKKIRGVGGGGGWREYEG